MTRYMSLSIDSMGSDAPFAGTQEIVTRVFTHSIELFMFDFEDI